MSDYIIEMLNITKEFPGIIANDNVTLQLRKGEIHALLGENGAGKSTLMSVLFGLYQPEKGEIRISSEVFTNITGAAATNCYGVKGMAVRSASDGLVHLLKRESMSKGVRVEFHEDDSISIDLHISFNASVLLFQLL